MDTQFDTVLAAYEARRADEANGAEKMLAIDADSGRLLNILVRGLERPRILELGTSFGYSGLWLAEAARATGGHVTTIEKERHKSDHARAQAQAAGLGDWIDHRVGDAVAMIGTLEGPFDFVFVDLWKDLYVPCLEAVFPRLAPGAILVADNMIRGGAETTALYAERIRGMPGIESVLLPVGNGLEVSRYRP